LKYSLEGTMLFFIHAFIVSRNDTRSSNGKQIFKNALPFTNDKLGAVLQLVCCRKNSVIDFGN